jgi:sarcosine oxidase subunit alpha
VLIIGAGIAGMTAAIHTAQAGINVVLVDENANLGGSLNDDLAADDAVITKLAALKKRLEQHPNISCIQRAYVAAYYADHYLPIVTPNGMIRMRAQTIIVATGAFEQPPVFRNNDLPGVMLSTAAQRLVHRYGVAPFSKGVVLTANSQGYRAALDLLKAGVTIMALVDLRKTTNEPLAEKLTANGIQIYQGHCIYEAVPTPNKLGVRAAIICPYIEKQAEVDTSKQIRIECDGVMMSAGWSPAAALLYQAGTKMTYDNIIQQFVPKQLPQGVFAAGKVNGFFEQHQRELDGERAANAALKYLHLPHKAVAVALDKNDAPNHFYPMVPHPKGKNFIDFDEDIQLKDFLNAAQEGFNNIELLKRFTTFGMGPSQGKHANMNAIRILSRIRQETIEKVGSTTARPFYHPTPLSHLAGYHFTPYRQTALHGCHQKANAVLMQTGAWMRPAYYKNNELTEQETIAKEVLAVREHAGIIDVSTLGKIEVIGKHAALFLEKVYTGRFNQLASGAIAYGLMIDESGVVLDDGVIARISEHHFYVTTSTSNQSLVYREMLRYAQIWQMDVMLNNVSSHYSAINIAGKEATAIISQLVDNKMKTSLLKTRRIHQLTIAKIDVLVMRTNFVSKTAFEIHVPFKQASALWNAILEAGKPYQLMPFGTEAQRILRLEMGHLLIGLDTDGLTNPFEAGFESIVHLDKPFFVGQRSLQIIKQKPCNKQLVAFTLAAKQTNINQAKECNLVIENNDITGRVTSISFSPTLQQTIGLAYVHPRQSTIGSTFNIRTDSGAMVNATVVNKPFIEQSEH